MEKIEMDSQIFQLPWHLTDNLEQVERNGGEGGMPNKRITTPPPFVTARFDTCSAQPQHLAVKRNGVFILNYTTEYHLHCELVSQGCSYKARSNSSAKTDLWVKMLRFKPALISATFLNGTQANFTTEPNILLCHRKVFVEIKVQRQSGVNTAQMIACWQRAL